MKSRYKWHAVPVALCLAAISATMPAAEPGRELAPVAMVADAGANRLFVAEAAAKRIAVVDAVKQEVLQSLAVPDSPLALALSRNGKLLFCAGGSPAGNIYRVSTADGKLSQLARAGHTPTALVLSRDETLLYACNRFDNDVSVIDIEGRSEKVRIPVGREPVAAALSPDGRMLFVANHLPQGSSDAGVVAASVTVIDTTRQAVIAEIRLKNGATALRGLCVSPDGKYVYVTHIFARFTVPTTQIERGWMNTNGMTIIDAEKLKLVDTVLLDSLDLGAANPWAVGCTPDGKHVCVSHAGTHELSVIDRVALHTKLAAPEEDVVVADTLTYIRDIRQRIRLAGVGPRALAVVGTRVYVAEYFSDAVSVVDTIAGGSAVAASFPLAPDGGWMSTVRRGEMLFNDARMCFQQWQSCASCHPDGRADGLNWDLLNDGMGNPKNTKSLLLSHRTPPAMISGVRGKAEVAVRAGIRFIQFAVRPESDAAAIDEYLKSMQPVPSPYLVDGEPSEAAERGREVFDRAGCARCHPAPLYTNMNLYDLGLGRDQDKGRRFDTPTLVECWRTGAYLYDGRAANMTEVLKKWNPDNKHGDTVSVKADEIKDLVEYVLSL